MLLFSNYSDTMEPEDCYVNDIPNRKELLIRDKATLFFFSRDGYCLSNIEKCDKGMNREIVC